LHPDVAGQPGSSCLLVIAVKRPCVSGDRGRGVVSLRGSISFSDGVVKRS
jgi:hypothetical protein